MDIPGGDLAQFRSFIHSRLGISIQANKDYLLESKLRRALEATGHESVARLLSDENPRTLEAITQAVTTNHTYFFRESSHFKTLVADLQARGIAEPLVWCAASSSGEEPYSLAITLAEAGYKSFLVVASDIDREMLRSTHQAAYTETRLKQVPPAILKKYFDSLGVHRGTPWFRVKKQLREHLVVKSLNLLDPHRFEGTFDAVFLRNALIYFDRTTQGKVVDQVSANLSAGGLLFLGHSESLYAIPHHTSFQALEAAVYRKAGTP